MSITSSALLSESDKNIYKKCSNHHRMYSGELDVFEATRYFSDYNEPSGYNHCATYNQKIIPEEIESWKAGRKSLDMPLRDLLPQQSHRVEKPKNEKKHKPPSSPGGRLASFINSLFKQAALKKKKSKSTTQSMKDEDESPGGRRWRRSSISHFRSSSSTDSRSTIYPSSNSGFRTPPPYTPKKVYKDLSSYLNDKQEVSYSKNINYGHVKSTILSKDVLDDKTNKDLAWLDDKLRLNNGLIEKCKISAACNKYLDKDRKWTEKYQSEEKEIRKFDELDDGADSDSSSDLFELQNYDLGYYPSGLPVYETTNLDSIKRGAPIISKGSL